jgi:hypothetical protein
MKFNEAVKKNISEENYNTLLVAEIINELIVEKNIFQVSEKQK